MNIPEDAMIVIYCPDRKNRKKIHQYLENKNRLSKTSLRIDSQGMYAEIRATYIVCYYCGFRRVPINDYHDGLMENNKDEYRTGVCPKCDEFISFEMNYDDWDDVTRLYHHNAIVIGNYLKNYARPSHAVRGEVTQKEFDNIMKTLKIYKINSPVEQISKKELQKYINLQLENL